MIEDQFWYWELRLYNSCRYRRQLNEKPAHGQNIFTSREIYTDAGFGYIPTNHRYMQIIAPTRYLLFILYYHYIWFSHLITCHWWLYRDHDFCRFKNMMSILNSTMMTHTTLMLRYHATSYSHNSALYLAAMILIIFFYEERMRYTRV